MFNQKEQRVFISFCFILLGIGLITLIRQNINKKITFSKESFSYKSSSSKESFSYKSSSFYPPKIKININRASDIELQKLPYIGPVISQRIIEYREKKGGFKKLEEMLLIKGIGQKKFEKLKKLIILEEN